MISDLLDFWKRDEQTAPNFSAWKTTPPRQAQTHPFPNDLPASLREALSSRGIFLSTPINILHGLNLVLVKISSSPPAQPAEKRLLTTYLF